MAQLKKKLVAAAPEAEEEIAPKRRPGRPRSGQAGHISRTRILRTALRMAKTIPLQELSIVTVAKKMDVTPALIHYYIGSREWLTSGVMNLFYRDLIKRWQEPTGEWKRDVVVSAHGVYRHFVSYAGIAAYVVSNSRFRIFQLTAFGERDYGAEVLERFTGIIRSVGLSGERTGIYSSQFMEFIFSIANSASHHIFPSEHRAFLEEKSASLDPRQYPNLLFSKGGPLSIDGELAFEEGCYLYLLGMQTELAGKSISQQAGVSLKACLQE